MSLNPPAEIKETPAASAGDCAEYDRQLAWLKNAIEEGWRSARSGELFTPEEVLAELEEHQRQWRASRSQA